ncbi:MAG: hypothetical protein J5I98_17105 [Phaeodactylibacter sp.]|nr:hypothetical protein [Phaeodactylibacter sp.]
MSKKEHRGRIQAQSDHLEESVSWAQDTPPNLEQGLGMVNELKEKLSKLWAGAFGLSVVVILIILFLV